MNEKILTNLRDAGCNKALITELAALPSSCARLCCLKVYRRELLNSIHAEQKKLEYLDYLIYQLRCDAERSCYSQVEEKGE